VDPSRVQLVRVTTQDQEPRLWAAATSREEAVDRVLSAIPAGSNARLLNGILKPREDAVYDMRPGEVRELSK
jgi:hypothetical protein